ncbi:MAG TPA: glycosyltransferase family 4 protein [Vicinamibacterales bacterium]|nr:glycosyltransferase family 4 protein [Vicinamibacterales bacterium]
MARAADGRESVTIHFVTPEYPPMLGGVSDYTHQIAAELARHGATVHVWGPSGIAAPPGSPVVVHPELGRFHASDLRRAGTVLDTFPSPRRLLVQWVPHGYGRRAMNLPFCFWVWRRAVAGDSVELIVHEPFVTFSGSAGQYALAAVQRMMTLMLLSAARRVWVTTESWTPLLEPYLSTAATRIVSLPVPSSLEPADAAAIERVRTRYAPGDTCLVGHFGTHGALVTPLLDAVIPLIAEANASAHFLLIGAGSEEFTSALVGNHTHLAGRVSATGALHVRDLPAHIAACDVLLQPYPDGVTTRRTSTMAGLSARVPVVSTSGKLTERLWLADGPVKLAPANDSRAIADHVLQLLADPVERRRQAEAGRAFYDTWLDVRHTVAALVE